eukprot:g807.t1
MEDTSIPPPPALSLRRELDTLTNRQLPQLSENSEDLSSWSRNELEREIIQLRHVLNKRNASLINEMGQIRDLLSHTATGKDEDYLQLNATIPAKEDVKVKDGDLLYPRYRRVDSDSIPPEEIGSPTTMICEKALLRALGGGAPGAVAMAAQVTALMWLRTTMNYQYRYGTSAREAMSALYAAGGIRRFYKGFVYALVLGPLGRFGDTAANTGVLYALDAYESTRELPSSAKSFIAAGAAAGWRVLLMPLDACKTVLQVEGKRGFGLLQRKAGMKSYSLQSTKLHFQPSVLFHGSMLHFSATFLGHYSWFLVYNQLNRYLPDAETLQGKLLRNASVGFLASLASDTTTNCLRVVKTVRQTFASPISYLDAAKLVAHTYDKQHGALSTKYSENEKPRDSKKVVADIVRGCAGKARWSDVFTRGLGTRLMANGMQGALFTVLWKGFESFVIQEIEEDVYK